MGSQTQFSLRKLCGVFRDTRFNESSHTTVKIRNTLCDFFSFLKYVAVCGWKRKPRSSVSRDNSLISVHIVFSWFLRASTLKNSTKYFFRVGYHCQTVSDINACLYMPALATRLWLQSHLVLCSLYYFLKFKLVTDSLRHSSSTWLRVESLKYKI